MIYSTLSLLVIISAGLLGSEENKLPITDGVLKDNG